MEAEHLKQHIIRIIFIIILLSSSSCASNQKLQENDLNGEMVPITIHDDIDSNNFVEPNSEESKPEIEPDWAKIIQTRGQLYQNLNLDGIGDSDDEIYLSVIKGLDNKHTATALRIHLGTGEVIMEIIPSYGSPTLQTGKLFAEDREAVVVSIDSLTNYGKNDIYVFDVCPPNASRTTFKRLDTSQISLPEPFEPDECIIAGGFKIVDIQSKQLQGLTIYMTGFDGEWRGNEMTLIWRGSKWGFVDSEQIIQSTGS